MLEIEIDKITISDESGSKIILEIAWNGPDDPMTISASTPTLPSCEEYENGSVEFNLEISREDIDSLQLALLNYLNCGRFDEEENPI